MAQETQTTARLEARLCATRVTVTILAASSIDDEFGEITPAKSAPVLPLY
jgi:hypothetical protein